MAEAATPRSGWGPRGGNEASIRADGLSGLRCDIRRKGWKQRLLSFSSWWQGIEAASCSKCTVRNWEARGFAERGGTGSGDGQDGGSRTGPRIGGTGREGRAGQQSSHGARGGREPSGQAARTRGQAARGRLSSAAAEAKEQGRCFWLLKEQIGAFQVMARLPE